MDYVLGSVAALVTGNVTPNRPRLMKRALTPTKHQASPNVTPKSELVEDRSIFLSPTLQKKKAVLKKSPKRIFQDTAADDNSENDSSKKVSSPKIEKVKKHLQDDLESGPVSEQQDTSMKSSKKKRNQQNSAPSPNKKSKTGDAEINPPIAQETTSKKKKKKASNQEVEQETVDTKNNLEKSVINNVKPPTVLSKKINKNARRRERKKKIKKKLLAEAAAKGEIIPGKESSSPKKAKHSDIKIKSQIESAIVKSDKGTKKSKKNKKNKELSITEEIEHNQNNENQEISSALETKKIKKEKNKKYVEDKTVQEAVETSLTISKSAATKMDADSNQESDDDELENDNNITESSNAFGITDTDSDQESADETDSEDENITTEDSTSIKKKKGKDFVNPNAVTQMDTDSEHESDNEIESENEEDVKEELEKTPEENNSSDEEDKAKETKSKKQLKKEEKKKKAEEREVDEDEVKKTVFVGNVLFNSKCKKEIKKLFSKYGAIDTVRIRTVPVKDGRVTPKLAVIKNELHPERTTVNVYVKFQNVSSVYEALKENNTVLNGNHLRVTTSESTGAEHDPRQAIFVGNIPFALEDEALREKFSGCGEIVSVRIVRDKATNAGKGFGYVNFQTKDAVELALSLPEEELTIKNKVLRVKRCSYPVNKGKVGKWNKGPQQENHDSRPPRGGFRGGRGRGSFQSNRGGFQSDRGGVQPNRGGFHSNRGSSFQSNRGGFQSNRGSFQSRGGFQGRGGFQDRGGRGSRGGKPGFGDRQNSFRGQDNRGGQDERGEGAFRRISHKRKIEEGNQGGPPNKVANDHQPSKEKKARKEFVGVTAEKRKKQKFDKGSKKKKIISEILTKQK